MEDIRDYLSETNDPSEILKRSDDPSKLIELFQRGLETGLVTLDSQGFIKILKPKNDEVQLELELPHKEKIGPKVSLSLNKTCFSCKYERSESYRCQSDSGHDVYCDHPEVNGKRIGDSSWNTPDWCPVGFKMDFRVSIKSVLKDHLNLTDEYLTDLESCGKLDLFISELIDCMVSRNKG